MCGVRAFGRTLADGAARCPAAVRAVAALERASGRRVLTAGFSRLAPGAHITPHRGYAGYSERVFRVHLALDVPSGDCALRVGRHVQRWRAGDVLAFNDLALHEAWCGVWRAVPRCALAHTTAHSRNRTSEPRTVLLLDLERFPGALPPDASPVFTPELEALLRAIDGRADADTPPERSNDEQIDSSAKRKE